VGLLLDLRDPGVGTVGLVDQQDHGQLRLQRLAQHEAGLRQRTLRRVDQQHDTVDHRQAALDLAAEVGVAGVSMTLIVTGTSVWMLL
jgi:response regulator of citrate/malate metabolism